nr:hypothetical protein [Marinicella sp. W31]MDC2877910.1 hypothetical protein [Marinicella sp. W31]
MNTSRQHISKSARYPSLRQIAKSEWILGIALLTSLIVMQFDDVLMGNLQNRTKLVAVMAWLFIVILAAAIGVVRHAEALSVRLGEPFGTLVLTLSITGIEVMSITAVMLHGENNPALVRDTLFSVVMIIMGACWAYRCCSARSGIANSHSTFRARVPI